MYCSYRPQETQLRHEVLLTGELLRWPLLPVNRGKFVDQEIRPDATMFIGPEQAPLHVELDTGEESYRQVKTRMRAYLPSREPVLWIAPSEERMDGLISHAGAIRQHAFFKVLGSDVFYDGDGAEYLAESLGVFPDPRVPD